MLNFIDNYSFIHASGCVGMGPSALLCKRVYNVVKMALAGLMLIKLSRTNFILVLQNLPIRMLYLFGYDIPIGCFLSMSKKPVFESFMSVMPELFEILLSWYS